MKSVIQGMDNVMDRNVLRYMYGINVTTIIVYYIIFHTAVDRCIRAIIPIIEVNNISVQEVIIRFLYPDLSACKPVN